MAVCHCGSGAACLKVRGSKFGEVAETAAKARGRGCL